MTYSPTNGQATLDLELCLRVLGLESDEHPRQVVRAAREQGWSFPVLALSLLKLAGVALGSGSADELRRARARKTRYAGIIDELVAVSAGRVVKGTSLAELYPVGVERAVGDVDFVVSDEQALWRAASVVLGGHPVETINISLFGQPDPSVLVVLEWPGDDPVLDNDYQIEICTTAFAGNAGEVSVRRGLPEDRTQADLLALAEERFQRPFNAKDVLDVAVLGARTPVDTAGIVEAALRWTLAPELVELFEKAEEFGVLGALAPTLPDLRAHAKQELARRAEWTPPTVPTGTDRITAALSAGKPVGGLLLRRVDRRDLLVVRVHHHRDGALLITPIGDFMLTDVSLIDDEDHAAALGELARLDATGALS